MGCQSDKRSDGREVWYSLALCDWRRFRLRRNLSAKKYDIRLLRGSWYIDLQMLISWLEDHRLYMSEDTLLVSRDDQCDIIGASDKKSVTKCSKTLSHGKLRRKFMNIRLEFS